MLSQNINEMIAANPEAVREALKRYEKSQASASCCSSKDIVYAIPDKYKTSTQEHFILICLDTKNSIRKVIEIHRGSMESVIVDLRVLFRSALKVKGCTRIIVAHNHPSGDPTPSKEDQAITERIDNAGKLLGLPLLDHIVFTKSDYNYLSLRDQGLFIS